MARFKEGSTDSLFLHGCLEDLLPEHSLAREVSAALDLLDFSCFEDLYKNDHGGSAAIAPRSLVGVWILALLRGVTSSGALAQRCETDVEFRWMMNDVKVCKSTLAYFRKYYLEQLGELSTQTLSGLARCGRLPAKSIGVDGTMLQAASSCGSVRTPAQLRKQRKALRTLIDNKLQETPEEQEVLQGLQEREAVLEKAMEELAALGIRENEASAVSEPEATRKKLKNGAFAPAHNAQISVDLDSGAILHTDIVAEKNDRRQLYRQAQKTQEQIDAFNKSTPGTSRIENLVADAQYHNTHALLALQSQGTQCFVPNIPSKKRIDPALGEFTYDKTNDCMICPQGNKMRRRKMNRYQSAITYQAKASDCRQCPLKPHCCPTTQTCGRSLNRPIQTEILTAIQDRTESPQGKNYMRSRRISVEGAFARLRTNLHMQRCRMWGKQGAAAELKWRQLAHNLCLLQNIWKPISP